MNDDTNPQPGSAEYDALMASRYRTQTSEGENPLAVSDHRQIVSPSGNALGIRKDSTLGPPGPKSYSATQADPAQIADLEREIARVRAELEQSNGFDPATGAPIMYYTGEQRRLREIRLAHLEQVELPGTQALVAAAHKWRAENVERPEASLQRQKDERERILARAEEIAEERVAQAEAARIVKQRGLGIG